MTTSLAQSVPPAATPNVQEDFHGRAGVSNGLGEPRCAPVIQRHRTAFQCLTGLSLHLVAPGTAFLPHNCENEFCRLMARTGCGGTACGVPPHCYPANTVAQPAPVLSECFAGLAKVVAPVHREGRPIASLWSGSFFPRTPTAGHFSRAITSLNGQSDTESVRRASRAYFATPQLGVERIQAIEHLLAVFARDLAIHTPTFPNGTSSAPSVVERAQRYIAAHPTEFLTLATLARRLHISRHYLCRLFKRHTAATLTEFVARVRVERAKALLADPNLRVTEVCAAAGFGSIPQFNSVFKRHVGTAPTTYRRSIGLE